MGSAEIIFAFDPKAKCEISLQPETVAASVRLGTRRSTNNKKAAAATFIRILIVHIGR